MRRQFWFLGLALAIIGSACTTVSPVLLYKDSSESNPMKLPLRVGLKIENVQAMNGVNIKTTVAPPFTYWRAEFPKGKQAEFLADMVRQYFLDSGIFDYTYNHPFKNSDVDVILNIRLNRFNLTNDKFIAAMTSWGTFVIPFGLMVASPTVGLVGSLATIVVPAVIKEKFIADYDMTAQVLLPDGKTVKEYSAAGKGKETLGTMSSGGPYADYIYYRSVFKKVFLRVMDDIKGRILADREQILQAYKNSLI